MLNTILRESGDSFAGHEDVTAGATRGAELRISPVVGGNKKPYQAAGGSARSSQQLLAIPSVGLWIEDDDRRMRIQETLRESSFSTVDCAHQVDCASAIVHVADSHHLREVCQRQGAERVIAVVDQLDFAQRLNVARVGCTRVVTDDVKGLELANLVDQLIAADTSQPRVLIVDDDPFVLLAVSAALEHAGCHVRGLTDPSTVLDAVADFQPDLLILDIRLPDCNGIEVAQILRQDEAMLGMPIVFLSAVATKGEALAALEAGGDDFLPKPVELRRIVSVVTSRLARARAMRTKLETDSLTGLTSHGRCLELLQLEVSRAHRSQRPLSVAVLDLDKFKQINDRFGHASGDCVIRRLAQVLRFRSRDTDIVGRTGGEEFTIVFPNTPQQLALKAMETKRKTFESGGCHTERGIVRATFSAGVTELMPGETAAQFWERADAALYGAKHQGRNRVLGS